MEAGRSRSRAYSGFSLASYAESGSFAFYNRETATYPISVPSAPEAIPVSVPTVARADYSQAYIGYR
ncbi:hypothetical protein [Sphingomonas sp.]|uniref:hypothetical protein n=1 Tax=Sphingomonas sp. TaxID=28214 RepID=UPI002EDA639A